MDRLEQEIDGLLRYVLRVRYEIACIDRPAEADFRFDSMGDQLDAIIKATEEATNTIMDVMERNDDAISKLRQQITNPDQLALLDQINNNGVEVFKACSFHDITGQRINKLAKSITYVEQRVDSLVSLWGKSQLAEVEVMETQDKPPVGEILSGPQLEGKGLSQNDIDSLFD